MNVHSLECLDPSDKPLLDLVFERIDDSMLREIAEADYGMDADRHFEALQQVKRGIIPPLTEWVPSEVLELIRWSEPEDPSWKPGAVGERGHWMRLFSCAVLIRAAAERGNEGLANGEDSTIIQLVSSAMMLGDATSHAALQFLCWRFATLDDWQRPLFAVAILLLCIFLGRAAEETVRFLMAAARSGDVATPLPGEIRSCLKAHTWQEIIHRVLVQSPPSLPASIRCEVREFGLGLMDERTAGRL